MGPAMIHTEQIGHSCVFSGILLKFSEKSKQFGAFSPFKYNFLADFWTCEITRLQLFCLLEANLNMSFLSDYEKSKLVLHILVYYPFYCESCCDLFLDISGEPTFRQIPIFDRTPFSRPFCFGDADLSWSISRKSHILEYRLLCTNVGSVFSSQAQNFD